MIILTQGDTALLNLTAMNGLGQPIDLTGAVFTTYFRLGSSGSTYQVPNSQHTANPDQVNNRGQFTLQLLTVDTSSIPIGNNKEIITKIVQGSSTIYYHAQNILNVLSQVPVQ